MTVELAMTRTDFVERAEAKGLVDVAVTTMDSPIGTLLLMATPRGLVRIAFESENRDEVLGEVATRTSRRGSSRRPRRLDAVRRELDKYFAGKLRDFDVPSTGRSPASSPAACSAGPHGSRTARWRATADVAVGVGTPRGGASRRQRARIESDPGRGAMPPRGPHRRRDRRLWRRAAAQALAARPRNRLRPSTSREEARSG